jgi:histo-blood group ABO system transferase
MSKINLCVIATAKYKQFLPQFLESAERFFLKGHDVHYCIFTDFLEEACLFVLEKGIDREVTYYKVEHKPWPHATIKRFHFFLQYKENLPQADYLFYCDVDSRFVAPIGDEILGDLVAVQHCGFVESERGTYETRPQSMAYIPKIRG